MSVLSKATLGYFLCLILAAISLVAIDAEVVIVPFIILAAYLAVFGLPTLMSLSARSWVYVLFFLTLFLDHPAARPYYDHNPFTEVIGAVYFMSLRLITGIPIPFSLFELVSLVFAAIVLSNRYKHLPSWEISPAYRNVLYFIIFGFPAAFIFACVLGMAKGHSVSLMITQIRNIPILVAWYIIGFYVINKPEMYRTIFKIITAAALYKALYALGVFFGLLGGSLGKLEYLIDHNSSLFLATAMIFLCAQFALNKRRSIYHALPALAMIAVMAVPYVINDRRSSFVGVILVAGFLPFLLPRKIGMRLILPYFLIGSLGLAFLLLKPSDGADFSSLLTGASYKGEKIVSYRSLENLNLYFTVMLNPITGLGFGSRFPIYAYMPDIAFAYELFDAIPHNSLLYIWAFTGPLGMALFTVCIASSIACCVKLLVNQTETELLLASFMTFAVIVQWLTYVFADIGLLSVRIGFIMAACAGGILRLYGRSIRFTNE